MNSTAPKLEKHILKLLDTQGFIDKYWEMLGEYSTGEAAYEAAERLHITNFGERKYKNFESFRVNMSRFLKKDKKCQEK